MNKYQRKTICHHYGVYLRNRCNFDPVGGFEDMRDLFSELADSDEKLKKEMEEIYNEIDNEN